LLAYAPLDRSRDFAARAFLSRVGAGVCARGHQVEISARDFAQTVELAMKAGMMPHVIGGHGGGKLTAKAGNLVGTRGGPAEMVRVIADSILAVSHNSYAQISAAASLGVRSVTLMDYEHQPANHLAFRLASRVIVPRAFSGFRTEKVRRVDPQGEAI
jgi:predicted glycosyltransferase